MRCPSCGTENEPDSRFCGGCGARLGGTLAPTHKIVDTGPAPVIAPPPSAAQQAQAIARQVSAEYAAQRSPSVPPTPMGQPSSQRSVQQPQRPAQPSAQQPNARPSAPVGVYAAPRSPVGSSQRPVAARSAEQSFQMPKRRWGLIIIVLIFDLGLAAAGAYLLNEGLAAAPETSAPPGKVGSAPTEVKPALAESKPAAKAIVVEPKPAAGSAGSAEPTIAAGSAEPPAPEPITEKPADEAKGSAQSRKVIKRRKPPKPIDPYENDPEPIGPPPPDTDE